MRLVLKIEHDGQFYRAILAEDDAQQVEYDRVDLEIRKALPNLRHYVAKYKDSQGCACILSAASFLEFVASVQHRDAQSLLKLKVAGVVEDSDLGDVGAAEQQLEDASSPDGSVCHEECRMKRFAVVSYTGNFSGTPCILSSYDDIEKAQQRFHATGIYSALVYDTRDKCLAIGTHTSVGGWLHHAYKDRPIAYSSSTGPAFAKIPNAAYDLYALNATSCLYSTLARKDPLRPLLEYAMAQFGAPTEALEAIAAARLESEGASIENIERPT